MMLVFCKSSNLHCADKISQVVILIKLDEITKLNSVLDDSSKFEKLDSVEENDNTLTIDKRIQSRFFELLHGGLLCAFELFIIAFNLQDYTQRPRLYWLSKAQN